MIVFNFLKLHTFPTVYSNLSIKCIIGRTSKSNTAQGWEILRPHILNIYCVRCRGTIRLLYNIVIFCPHHYLSVFTHRKKVRLKGKGQIIQGVPKKVLIECCWSHSAPVQSLVAGTSWAWKILFCSFLTKTKQDQALQRHFDGKIRPHILVMISCPSSSIATYGTD